MTERRLRFFARRLWPGRCARSGSRVVSVDSAPNVVGVERILSLQDPERKKDSRTVINVAMLQSGSVFNHKPEMGWFSLDIRSMDRGTIETIGKEVRGTLAEVAQETTIGLKMKLVPDTPGGQRAGARDSGSSNINIRIWGATLAIGIGGERGGQRGFPDEWADIPVMVREAKEVVLLAVTMGR